MAKGPSHPPLIGASADICFPEGSLTIWINSLGGMHTLVAEPFLPIIYSKIIIR